MPQQYYNYAYYKAPRPKKRSTATRVLLWASPPTWIWRGSKKLGNHIAGKWLTQLLLDPKHSFQDRRIAKEKKDKFLNDYGPNFRVEQPRVETFDDVILDTIELTPKTVENPRNGLYIINVLGKGMYYEQILKGMKKDAEALNATVIGFNYRNVIESTNIMSKSKDTFTDTFSQVKRLLAAGIQPQQIILKGHSAGGGIAAEVGKYFHEDGKPINVFDGRSFISFSKTVASWFATGNVFPNKKNTTGYTTSTTGKMLGMLIEKPLKLGLVLGFGEINGKAIKDIPPEYRETIVVRAPKSERDNIRRDDPIVPHHASVYQLFKKEEKRNARDHKPSSIFSPRRKMMTIDPHKNGHLVQLHELVDRTGQTAHQFFIEWANSRFEAYQANQEEATPPTLVQP